MSEPYSEDSESEDEWSSDEEPQDEQTHAFTGEKYTFESLTSIPEYQDVWKDYKACSEPGHSCLKNFQKFMEVFHNDHDMIPREKTPVKCFSRNVWGAAPPKAQPELPSLPTLKLVFYYDVGMGPCLTEDECKKAVKDLQTRQVEEDGLSDIGFNFVVGGDMNVYEGRGWHAQPDESLKYPEWRHRRIDVAFLTPILKNVRCPDQDLMFRVYDFCRVAVMNHFLHINSEMYEIKDHYKCLVPSPPVPVSMVSGEEIREQSYINMPNK